LLQLILFKRYLFCFLLFNNYILSSFWGLHFLIKLIELNHILMLYTNISNTLRKLYRFLADWNIFLVTFFALVLYSLYLLTLILWFVLDLFIDLFYCFLILLIFDRWLVHNTFISVRFLLLYTLISNTSFHIVDTNIFDTWLHIIYTLVFNTGL
jgi:hypothetical protein